MDIKQMEYFTVLAKELHFTKAAEKLGISQPSLSQQIRMLEHEVGTPLFDRIGKKTMLTGAGKILLEHARKVFYELEQAKLAINDLKGLQRGRLVIGALLTVVSYLLPPSVLTFHKKYPNIELKILGLRTGDIVDGLLENELDLGIGSFPAAPEEIQSIPLFTEKLALAVPKNHQFPVHPEPSLMSLAKLPSILLPDHYHLRQQVNQACKKLGFSPRPMFEMTSMTTIINMVSEGIAITVLPLPYLKFVSHPKIDILPLDSPSLTRHIVVAYHRDRYRGAAANAFIEQLTRFPFQINSIHR